MNLGGIKTSSVELERACVQGVEGVVEAAAVGCPTPGARPTVAGRRGEAWQGGSHK